ncbi:MAG TPA: glycosyltransferase family 9 protein [Chitinivibrionales bacterium]|jgi:ADP-heptose:LPS heptosyltransferase|nr:glycosyltransferase family 9 protein [Chitinivibrionales bacterium]
MLHIHKSAKDPVSLVYHTGGLGDFITAFPALGEWKKRNAQSRSVLLGKPSYGILGIHCGLFDEIWDVESAAFSWLYAPETAISLSIKEEISAVRSALLFTAPDSPVLARFRQFGMQRLMFQGPFPRKRMPIGDYHLSLFSMGSSAAARDFPVIAPHPDFKSEADRLLDGIGTFVALHPGSGSARKSWPLRRYLDLAEQLAGRKVRIVWILGPAEKKFSACAGNMVARDLSLPVLVHVLSRCVLYVGNDSGISHLAAAAGAPSVVLFGPSDPAVWRPMGDNVTVVAAPQEACFPCHPSTSVPADECGKACMDAIPVSQVFDACMTVLRKN